jgi:hypothetical protein
MMAKTVVDTGEFDTIPTLKELIVGIQRQDYHIKYRKKVNFRDI